MIPEDMLLSKYPQLYIVTDLNMLMYITMIKPYMQIATKIVDLYVYVFMLMASWSHTHLATESTTVEWLTSRTKMFGDFL